MKLTREQIIEIREAIVNIQNGFNQLKHAVDAALLTLAKEG